MEQRKVQITGGNSYIVSLPRDWIKKTGLSKGNYLGVETNEDGTLTIFPKSKERIKKTFSINLTKSDSLNNRLLISKYLEGYDIIELVSKDRIPKESRKSLMKTVQNLIGIEIFEETSNKFVLSSLIDFGSIKIDKIIKRLIILTNSIFLESIKALEEGNWEFAQEIIPREDEVDKFYFHGIRELSEALKMPQLQKDVGINRSTDILSYITVIKSIERISDYLINILEIFIDMEKEIPKEIVDYSHGCFDIFNDVTENVFTKNLTKANDTLDKLKGEEKKVPSIIEIGESSYSTDIISAYAKITDYFVRILKHCANLSE
ncbi:MAG TPA: phosphate uptake regulator PhoU, partial [Candidatus Methanofastidiosa archaeon]|nr:phosphate uptake regulator PhoU [Candidatus Methanofastidiosa archaeon]